MSTDAIHEMPSPASTVGDATVVHPSAALIGPNEPSAASSNDRGSQSSIGADVTTSRFAASARASSRPNESGRTNGRRSANDDVSTSRAMPSTARVAVMRPSRWVRRTSTGASTSATSNNDTTVSWAPLYGWVTTSSRVPSRSS